jgi:hypothetical protein
MYGSESRRAEARYKAQRAFFLLLSASASAYSRANRAGRNRDGQTAGPRAFVPDWPPLRRSRAITVGVLDMAYSLSWRAEPAYAGEAGARPDHPISGNHLDSAQVQSSIQLVALCSPSREGP